MVTTRKSAKLSKWERLPVELQQQVLGSLDNLDRLQIRQVSKEILSVSENIPIVTHSIHFLTTPKNKYFWLNWTDKEGQRSITNRKECKKEKNGSLAVKSLLNFFACRFSKVTQLEIENIFEIQNGIDTVEKIIAEAHARNIRIRAEEVRLNLLNAVSAPLVIQFFELFDADVLKTLKLIDPPGNVVDAISETEQFRSCSKLSISSAHYDSTPSQHYSLRNMLHLVDFRIRRDQYTAQELFDLVQSYRLKPLKKGDRLQIYHTTKSSTEEEISNVLDAFPTEPNPRPPSYARNDIRVIYMADPELQLIVDTFDRNVCMCVAERRPIPASFLDLY
ncbi:hypothetical protein CRE_21182 [Caenorhabditis remanei]|uniref:Uncharacterized protein n=1 Tax=Caenorhabditis remanei TaxID=31234 RepID=E3MF74_CAERE|nr:hypothetical protein CRE_21182 [Caenorhabditis remanei]